MLSRVWQSYVTVDQATKQASIELISHNQLALKFWIGHSPSFSWPPSVRETLADVSALQAPCFITLFHGYNVKSAASAAFDSDVTHTTFMRRA